MAIKVLKESAGRSAEEDFVREVSIMSAFRHANILSLIGVVHRGKPYSQKRNYKKNIIVQFYKIK